MKEKYIKYTNNVKNIMPDNLYYYKKEKTNVFTSYLDKLWYNT